MPRSAEGSGIMALYAITFPRSQVDVGVVVPVKPGGHDQLAGAEADLQELLEAVEASKLPVTESCMRLGIVAAKLRERQRLRLLGNRKKSRK